MRTGRGLERLVTFVDAVVAIAITLLVLPLVDVLGDVHDGDLGTVLRDNDRQFAAFLLSFLVIAQLWQAHHRIVEHVSGYDGLFVRVSFAWMLTVVFLPFATQVAAVYGAHSRLAVALYLGTVALSSLCLALLSLLISRRAALRRDGVLPDHLTPPGWLATSGLLVGAFVLGVALPAVNYWATLLLLLTGPVERLVRRRARGPAKGQPPLSGDTGTERA